MDYIPLLIAGAMIVFMITSSRKRKAQAAQMASKVAPGAKVMLSSGIYAEVVSVADDRAVVKSAGSTSLEVAKGAIVRVIENAPEKKSSPAKSPASKTAASKPAVKAAAKKPVTKK
jgi:preprotein translocase subunit YajC